MSLVQPRSVKIILAGPLINKELVGRRDNRPFALFRVRFYNLPGQCRLAWSGQPPHDIKVISVLNIASKPITRRGNNGSMDDRRGRGKRRRSRKPGRIIHWRIGRWWIWPLGYVAARAKIWGVICILSALPRVLILSALPRILILSALSRVLELHDPHYSALLILFLLWQLEGGAQVVVAFRPAPRSATLPRVWFGLVCLHNHRRNDVCRHL